MERKIDPNVLRNGLSVRNAFRVLGYSYGQNNRPSEAEICRLVQKFEESGLMQNYTKINLFAIHGVSRK